MRTGLLLGALAILVASCASEEPVASDETSAPAASPSQGGRLVVAMPLREPEPLLRLLFEPLATFDADGEVVPFLAESIEPNDTYDRWTITVREGIEFHDGTPLDADVVKRNLDVYSVDPIYRTDPLSPIVSTTVVDDRTVEVELAEPWVTFPAHLTAEQSEGTGLIASPATLDAMGPLFLADPTVPGVFGTGPFVFVPQDATEERWVVERNPDYWQDGLPYVDEVELRVVPETAARLSLLDAGEADIAITDHAPDDVDDGRVLTQDGDPEVLAVALNLRRPPLDDARVREALVAATDVDALARAAGVDPSELATGPFGPGSPWTDPDVGGGGFDLPRAQELIGDYEDENGPVSITLGAQDLTAEGLAVQQGLATQWAEAGIDVESNVIEPFEQTTTLLIYADFDAVLETLFGKPDPDLYYFWWHSSALGADDKVAAYNYIGLDDPAIDDALDEARGTDDVDARVDAMHTVQERLTAARPYVWLWGTRWSAVTSANLRGLDAVPLPGGGTRLPMLARGLNLEGAWFER